VRFVSPSLDNKRRLSLVPPHWRSIVNGNILNSKGVHVALVTGDEVFSLKGQKLYDLRGAQHLQVERRPRWSLVERARY
jgi:hypothetical protein